MTIKRLNQIADEMNETFKAEGSKDRAIIVLRNLGVRKAYRIAILKHVSKVEDLNND